MTEITNDDIENFNRSLEAIHDLLVSISESLADIKEDSKAQKQALEGIYSCVRAVPDDMDAQIRLLKIIAP